MRRFCLAMLTCSSSLCLSRPFKCSIACSKSSRYFLYSLSIDWRIYTMSYDVKTKSKYNVREQSGWDKAIQDTRELLDRVERRAEKLRGAIRTFIEYRDAGEPYSGTPERR